MEATLTLNQAGRQLGVDDDALTRLIQMGALPEARRVPGCQGPEWVIPERQLPSIAARNGWTIDLRGSTATVERGPVEDPVADAGTATNRAVEPATPTSPSNPTGGPVTRTPDREAAIEISEATPTEDGSALVVRADGSPVSTSNEVGAVGAPSVSEVLDLALLDRLLGVQEERAVAEVRVQESKHALAALNATHNRVTGELEVERRERMVAADRYREERMARAVADAKVAELRDRVIREMALAEAEKQARADALHRSTQAEREAAKAFAAMGWLARRRYRRLSDANSDG